MANLFFANDLGDAIIYNASGELAYHKIGTSTTPVNASSSDVDTASITAFSFRYADINGKKDYTACEHAISGYLTVNATTTTTIANTWVTLLASAPSTGIIRVWGVSGIGSTIRVNGVTVTATPVPGSNTTKRYACAINVAAGDLVEVKYTSVGTLTCNLLPQSY